MVIQKLQQYHSVRINPKCGNLEINLPNLDKKLQLLYEALDEILDRSVDCWILPNLV